MLFLIVFLPILAAIAIAFGAPARLTALGASAVTAVLGLIAFFGISRDGGMSFVSSIPLLESPQLALAFGIDGISATLVLLTVIVLLCAVWVSPKKIEGGGERLYYASSLLIAAGALGAFCATDLFFFYAFHELALIPTFLMIGMHGHGREKVAAAWKITIYLGAGSLVLLGGLIALYANLSPESGPTFDIATLTAEAGNMSEEAQKWIFLPLLIGFGILVSLFPFHSWAAPAYAAAPTPVAMLHAGVLKKFGLYGLIRVAMPMLPKGFEAWETLLLVLLLGNILYIGFVTIAQRHLDKMLGQSSVMHMGYAFLGIACVNAIGWSGAVMMMFAHGISIALLFALCGSLRERLPTLEMSRLGGLASKMPVMAVLFGFAAFASLGLPGFANFASEVTIFFGAFKDANGALEPLQIATILALWGVVISAVYMLRGYRNIFQGDAVRDLSPDDLGASARLPIIILIVVLLLTGFFPNLILNLVSPAVEVLLGTR